MGPNPTNSSIFKMLLPQTPCSWSAVVVPSEHQPLSPFHTAPPPAFVHRRLLLLPGTGRTDRGKWSKSGWPGSPQSGRVRVQSWARWRQQIRRRPAHRNGPRPVSSRILNQHSGIISKIKPKRPIISVKCNPNYVHIFFRYGVYDWNFVDPSIADPTFA